MIVDKLLDIVFAFITKMFDGLPIMNVDIDLSVLDTFLDILGAALYFFPWQKVVPILVIIMLLQMWRIVVSIVKVIWQLLPFV